MTSRPGQPSPRSTVTGAPGSGAGGVGASSAPASAGEVFGRFVRTLERLDVARNAPPPARKSRERKAETRQSWEVPGCGKIR